MNAEATSDDADSTAAGWTPVDGDPFEPQERKEFDSVDFLNELNHKVRGPIMRRLRQPASIAELAAHLEVPVTRLYHHIDRLVEMDLIKVVATRKVSAVIERRYQVVAKGFSVTNAFFESADRREISAALGSLFTTAQQRFQHEIESGALTVEDEDAAMLWLGALTLTEEDARGLKQELAALTEKYSDRSDETLDDASSMTIFFAAFPQHH